jgi:hypothetical protein
MRSATKLGGSQISEDAPMARVSLRAGKLRWLRAEEVDDVKVVAKSEVLVALPFAKT